MNNKLVIDMSDLNYFGEYKDKWRKSHVNEYFDEDWRWIAYAEHSPEFNADHAINCFHIEF